MGDDDMEAAASYAEKDAWPHRSSRVRDQSRRLLSARVWVGALVLLGLALVPVLSAATGQPFYVTLFSRIMVLALAATGLNLVLGYGGMVSFGHSLYIGVGAYAVGILSSHGIVNGWAHAGAALGVGLALAVPIGIVCLRVAGMGFIMITLAFAQMLYFFVVSLKMYGGDDGLAIAQQSQFAGLDLARGTTLYYVIFSVLALTLLCFQRLVHSRFGMVIRGCKSNQRRVAALGISPLRYKLTAYVISALVCVLAGVLMANLTLYASSSYMQWSVSGELIVMVVLGGLGTVLGPVVGAIVLLTLEETLSSFAVGLPWDIDAFVSSHWMALLGLFIVAIGIALKQGLYGVLPNGGKP